MIRPIISDSPVVWVHTLVMNKRFLKWRLALFVAVVASVSFASDHTWLGLSGKMLSGMDEASNALDTLTRLQTAAQDALAGRKVSASSDWSKLADRYDKAALETKHAPLATAIPTTNVVSARELSECSTRASAKAKLNQYLQDLEDAEPRGRQAVTKLDVQLENVRKAKQALAYLISVHEKLMALPVVGTSFGLNWLDLNTRVSSSLSDLGDAFKDQKSRIQDDLNALPKKIQNYRSNLQLVNSLPKCSS